MCAKEVSFLYRDFTVRLPGGESPWMANSEGAACLVATHCARRTGGVHLAGAVWLGDGLMLLRTMVRWLGVESSDVEGRSRQPLSVAIIDINTAGTTRLLTTYAAFANGSIRDLAWLSVGGGRVLPRVLDRSELSSRASLSRLDLELDIN